MRATALSLCLVLFVGLPLGGCGDDPDSRDGATGTSAAEQPAPKRPLHWTLPTGWVQQPERSTRIVTAIPEGAKQTECYVSGLKGNGGGLLANVNRWRRQMGLPAFEEAKLESLERIDMLGTPSVLMRLEGTYTGMAGKRLEAAVLLGVICPRPQSTLFVKMFGPPAEMAGARADFLAFCRSLTH